MICQLFYSCLKGGESCMSIKLICFGCRLKSVVFSFVQHVFSVSLICTCCVLKIKVSKMCRNKYYDSLLLWCAKYPWIRRFFSLNFNLFFLFFGKFGNNWKCYWIIQYNFYFRSLSAWCVSKESWIHCCCRRCWKSEIESETETININF